jgi:polyketide synthase 12
MSQAHIRVLHGQIDLGTSDLDLLATQLTAALDGPLLLYVSTADVGRSEQRLGKGWQELVQRVCRP